MSKKILITIMLCFIFANQCFAFSDIDRQFSKATAAIDELSAIGIVKGYEDGTFRPDALITRAEFVAMLNRALGLGGGAVSGGYLSFPDVDTTHWAASEIGFGVSIGYISGYEDKTFRPDSNITYMEVIKILVSAVGYSSMAEENGGYPNGYVKTANQLGILKALSFSQSQEANRENAVYLLYQTMKVEIVEIIYGRENTYQKTGETLMDRLLKQEKLSSVKGIVTKTAKTGLKGEGLSKTDQICIDDVVYNTDKADIEQYLGMRVEAYYYTESEGDMPVITSVSPINNSIFEITADDFEGAEWAFNASANVKAGFVEYDEGKKRNLSSDLSVIYNGKAIVNFTGADIKITNGKITLIENSMDSLYDVIIIEESFSVVVEKVSVATEMIFLKSGTIGDMKRIGLDSKDPDFYYNIHDKDGNGLSIGDLSENDIINVRADKTMSVIGITVHTEKIEGNITEYNSEDNEIGINNEIYKITRAEDGSPMITPDMNVKGAYYADINGEIVYFEEGELILENLGLVQGVSVSKKLESVLSLRIITGGIINELTDKSNNKPYAEVGNSSWTIYETEDTIRFNGSKTSANVAAQMINPGDLLKYSVNNAGKISAIDVWTPDVALNDDAYNPEIKSFGGEFYIDKNTAVFCMPTNSAADDDYFINVTLNSGEEYEISAFLVDEDTQIAKAAVIRQEMIADMPGRITNSTGITVISKLRLVFENDGEVLLLEGFSNGKAISETIKSEARVYTIAKELHFGDVIYMSKNSQNFVDNIEFVQSFSPIPPYFHRDSRLQNERIFGKLHTVKRNKLDKTSNVQQSAFTINLGVSEEANQELVEMRVNTKVMPSIYMIDSVMNKITVVTIDDLYSSGEVGYDRASNVFICKKKFDVTGIVISK